MPARNKRKQKYKQQQETSSQKDTKNTDEQINPQTIQINNNNNQSKIQISSAEAQIYFEYLRKKISHQANDPFSLPFLNLKFQQLESWKGATQQLNLESRIYGMRVDNCHDYTVKMLNYVIRNQQQQIGRPQSKHTSTYFSSNSEDLLNNNQPQSEKNYNFHLEKPQKLISVIQVDKNLTNHSLWKVIFKKSETLQKIQLNTLEISNNLSLQLDEKNVKWCKKHIKEQQNYKNNQFLQQQDDGSFFDNVFSFYKFSTDRFAILKQINTVKNDVSKQIEQILQYKHQRQNHQQQTTQQPLYQNYFGYQQLDFDGLYQQFHQFTKYQSNAKSNRNSQNTIFDPQQSQNRQQIFVPIEKNLYSIPIDHFNMINSQPQQFLHQQFQDANNQQEHSDLYEPHKDILFHSTLKKTRASKRLQVRNLGKKRKNYKTLIDFQDPSVVINRKNIFKQRKQLKNNIQNDNLVPINYVVLYEARNPFKKPKKVIKTSNKISFYDNFQSQPLIDIEQQIIRGKQSLQKMNISQSLEQPFFFNQHNSQLVNTENTQFFQGQNFQIQRNYRNVSMKTVKNQIRKEISHIEENSMQISNQRTRLSNLSFISQITAMDSYLEQQGKRIGLKFLKHKMENYDPLDILMSILHVAYENQVLLEPIYTFSQQDNQANGLKLQDIVIQGQSFL